MVAPLVVDTQETVVPAPSGRRVPRSRIIAGILLLVVLAITLVAAFATPFLQLASTAVLLLALVIVLLLAAGMLMIALLMTFIAHEEAHERATAWLRRMPRLAVVLAILVVALGTATVGSQLHAATPPILGANGQPLPGSIASMEQVTLNGSRQWITIRGKSVHHPVLLFLMGGPGGGGFPDQGFLTPLEDHFVVVNWDQPNTGKSYGDILRSQLTPQRYVDDAYALTQQLCARFHQSKVYVLGSSWGSILGIMLVQQHPDLFYAYVGHGQMVNTTENDVMGYQFALAYASGHGDSGTVNTLRHYGPPPYVGEGMVWKYAAYMNVLQDAMGLPSLTLGVPLMPWFTAEYGLVDRINYVRGFLETFSTVYPQLRDLDFTTQAAKLGVPVYILAGRADVNAMASLTERYYTVLQAPHKELIWFKSGHSMTDADTGQFVDVMVNTVLAQTYK
jgi:pimeloyl-ACP methyl ester carboxylesterase